MARRPSRAPLSVFLNSRLVGQLTREPSGAIDFKYDADWLSWEYAMPVSLSLPLREDRYIGQPVSNVFDNLLPDNEGIRKLVAARVRAEGTDPFSLLTAIGRDCVGALQFLPAGADPGPAGIVEGHALTEAEIAATLRSLATNPLGIGAHGDDDDQGDDGFRLSIAGAQEKTALLKHKGKWLRPHGATATTHILKPQIGQLPNGVDLSNSVENEYLCLKLTAALGLASASVEIEDFEDKRVLVVERFDRLWDDRERLLRVPQEDCCQALSVPWTQKYESDGGPGVTDIVKLLAASDEAQADQRRFLKTIVTFWLLGAPDGHAKNFSVAISAGGGFRLTPLYDVISAQPSVDHDQIRHRQFKLAMAVGDSHHYAMGKIAPRHLTQSAVRAGMNPAVANEVFDEIIQTSPAALETTLAALPPDFPEAVSHPIARALTQRTNQLATRD